MCYTQKQSFTSVSVKVVDTYRATTQLNKYPLLFTSLFDIGNVSADQDGSRLCSYLPLYFAFELVFCLTILHGMATYRPLLPNIDQVQRKDIFYQE